MTTSAKNDAEALLRAAAAIYADDPGALAVIDQLEQRLREPLRLAVAGMVKAGKSTLLNALLGEQIAPTDAGECTRLVTWYRYSPTPVITIHLRDAELRRMPVRRRHGRLNLDLGDIATDDVEWIDIGWPLEILKSMVLIDTPGMASMSKETSLRATRFLTSEEVPTSADAVIYLMRHLHASDVSFLEAFRDTAAGVSQTICSVGVLSRADEIGSGHIGSLLSAAKVARRYESEPVLASLVLGVIPVAGLLAEGARTLRESEYTAFRTLAAMDRVDRERLFVSADRFTGPTDTTTLSPTVRRALLGRFALFGVRLATALIRGGVSSSSELAEAIVQQSGLIELQQFVRTQFRTRATTLKVRGVLISLEKVIRDRPRDGVDDIRSGIERISVTAHALRELTLLATARSQGLALTDEDGKAAQRIIGGDGTLAHLRLGLPEDSDLDTLRERVETELAHWRTLAESPLTASAAVSVCRVVIRSLEEVSGEVVPFEPATIATIEPQPASEIGSADDALGGAADVVTAGGPGHGGGEDAGE